MFILYLLGLKREPTRAGAFSVSFADGTNLERERTSKSALRAVDNETNDAELTFLCL